MVRGEIADTARVRTRLFANSQVKGFRHLYIDAFAGAGEHVSRRTGAIIPGSPLNALATDPPFDEYHFIELNPSRTDNLRRHTVGRSDVQIYSGDCNDVLLNVVFPRAKYEDFRRTLCLLDPYNIGVSWEVVHTAGAMRSVEIFLNFMVMDMNMNVLLTDPDKAVPAQVARMNRFWGDESWREAVYEEDRQGHLFGAREIVKVEDANEKIAAAYRRRLIEVAGFKFAPRPLRFVNSTGATIYYLFFASPDPTGNKIVQDIFNKYRV